MDTTEIQRILRDYYEQENGQPRRNGQVLRKVRAPKTEPGRNRK